MCNHTARLVAWLDREASGCEAAEIERHLRTCAECRACVAEYERVSGAFDGYCDSLLQDQEGQKTFRAEPVVWAAAAVILLMIVLAYPRRRGVPSLPQPTPANAAVVSTVPPAARTLEASAPLDKSTVRFHRHRSQSTSASLRTHLPMQTASQATFAPVIQIAIPADAIFPPGALPEGVNFVADLRIGADGRVEQLLLWPRPIEFERRSYQP